MATSSYWASRTSSGPVRRWRSERRQVSSFSSTDTSSWASGGGVEANSPGTIFLRRSARADVRWSFPWSDAAMSSRNGLRGAATPALPSTRAPARGDSVSRKRIGQWHVLGKRPAKRAAPGRSRLPAGPNARRERTRLQWLAEDERRGQVRRRCAPTACSRRRPPASLGRTACGQHRSRRTAPIPARGRYVPSGCTPLGAWPRSIVIATFGRDDSAFTLGAVAAVQTTIWFSFQ